MKTALYSHDLTIAPRQLLVLKENENKTVDLGRLDEKKEPVLVVGSCPVSDVIKAGHCVIESEATEAPAAKENSKKK